MPSNKHVALSLLAEHEVVLGRVMLTESLTFQKWNRSFRPFVVLRLSIGKNITSP